MNMKPNVMRGLLAILVATLLMMEGAIEAATIAIGNGVPLTDWNRARASIRVFDSSVTPIPIRDIDLSDSTGQTASLSNVSSLSDGLISADVNVDGYGLGGRAETSSAPETIFVVAQLRDQILVEADFDENTALEFEFSLDYSAVVASPGFAGFQFTLFAQKPDGSFLLLDDAMGVDFGLGDGPYVTDDSVEFTVSTAASGMDDVVITSGAYVPLQFSLTGEAAGTSDFDFLNTLSLTGLSVKRSSDGAPWGAHTTSSIDPANPIVNTNPVPEPAVLHLLFCAMALAGLLSPALGRRQSAVYRSTCKTA